EDIDRSVDVAGAERDVLDSLAFVFAQELLDLALVVLALVERNPDLAAGRGHRLGEETRLLPLDVEVTDLAEVEEPLVEVGPDAHAAAVHVVRQMVDVGQLRVRGRHALAPVWMEVEVDLVDRAPVTIEIDEEKPRAADPLDRRDVELAVALVHFDAGRAEL